MVVILCTLKPWGSSLSVWSLDGSAPASRVHFGWRMSLDMRRHAWVEKLCVLSWNLLLGACYVARSLAHVGHLLLVHRVILLAEVLNSWLMVIRFDHFLNTPRERSLRASLCLGVDDLMMLWHFLILLLISWVPLMLISLHVACHHVLLRRSGLRRRLKSRAWFAWAVVNWGYTPIRAEAALRLRSWLSVARVTLSIDLCLWSLMQGLRSNLAWRVRLAR